MLLVTAQVTSSTENLYKCLNRTILHQLSRPPPHGVADMMSVVYALHKLIEHRALVFGPGNYDPEFLGCLCYCLLQLIDDPSAIRYCVSLFSRFAPLNLHVFYF